MRDTDAEAELMSKSTPFLNQRSNRRPHIKRRLHRLQCGIRDRNGVIEENHHPVPGVMFERAAILMMISPIAAWY